MKHKMCKQAGTAQASVHPRCHSHCERCCEQKSLLVSPCSPSPARCCQLTGALFSSNQVRELESREAELRRRDTFYKEQLGRIERKVRLALAPFSGARS